MLDQDILVSVIIPTFNNLSRGQEKFLRQAIDSVIGQTYKNHELIIVDDASSDKTPCIVRQFYPELRLICLSTNLGAGGARNKGIEISNGSLVAFLDSDDYWHPTYLEKQVASFNNHSDIVLSYSNFVEIKTSNGTEKEVNRNWESEYGYRDAIHFQLSNSLIFTLTTVVVKRAKLLEAGLFNESLKISHDRELYLRLLLLGNLSHIRDYLAVRHIHTNNISGDIKRSITESSMVLDLFFSSPSSESYKSFEPEARARWARRWAKRVWQAERNMLLFLVLNAKAILLLLQKTRRVSRL